MSRVAVVTDSNSGITQNQAKELGIRVMPMPFYINEEMLLEDIDLTQEQFYERLTDGADIHTSTPVLTAFSELWDELLQEYDEIVHIPMSSGLSASCQTAAAMAQEYDGKVQVVDNQRISVTQKQSVRDAQKLIAQGKSAAQIKEILEERKLDASIYITLETLKYLKKGGRITPAAAAIGTILNLKPVLQIQGDKLDAYSKARGKNRAKAIMIDAIKKDLLERFGQAVKDGKMKVMAAYTGNAEEAMEWKKLLEDEFGTEVEADPLSLSVACHIGYGALAVAVAECL